MLELTAISKEDLESIHQATLQVLSHTGVVFKHPEGRKILAEAKASLHGERRTAQIRSAHLHGERRTVQVRSAHLNGEWVLRTPHTPNWGIFPAESGRAFFYFWTINQLYWLRALQRLS